MDTEILLMDEPFSALDAKNRIALQELLLKLWEGEKTENKKTVVFVTHDIDEAIFLSDKIVVLTSHLLFFRHHFSKFSLAAIRDLACHLFS